MTPVLQPFLSELPLPAKARRVPVGTFTVARVSRTTAAPWSASQRPVAVDASLPQGVLGNGRKHPDMSRHATIVLA